MPHTEISVVSPLEGPFSTEVITDFTFLWVFRNIYFHQKFTSEHLLPTKNNFLCDYDNNFFT